MSIEIATATIHAERQSHRNASGSESVEPARANDALEPHVLVKACPCCGNGQFVLFTHWLDVAHEATLDYQFCQSCGLVFMSPQFTEEDLNTFYARRYWSLYTGDARPKEADRTAQRERARHLSQIIQTHIPHIMSHLDIGCSAGELLLTMRQVQPNLVSAGVELSEAHRDWCIERGLAVYSSIEQLQATHASPQRFDLISLSHVLEHIPEPVEFLKTLSRDVLAPGGHILIEVPNLFGHVSFEIAHVLCFYQKTLVDVLGQAGYRVIWSQEHSVPRNRRKESRYLQKYITVIAAVRDENERRRPLRAVSLRKVRWMRFFGATIRNWPVSLPKTARRAASSLKRKAGLQRHGGETR